MKAQNTHRDQYRAAQQIKKCVFSTPAAPQKKIAAPLSKPS